MTTIPPDTEVDITSTRSELLRLRGYPDDIVAGNGRRPTRGGPEPPTSPPPAPELPVGSLPTPEAAPGPVAPLGPACEVCGTAIPAARVRMNAKTCSTGCSAERDRQHKRDQHAARRAARGNEADAPPPERAHITAPRQEEPAARSRLVALVLELARAGLIVRLEVDGALLTVG